MARDSSNQPSGNQRISRLTPLGSILALIDAKVAAVAPRRCAPAAALGATLAEDVVAPMLPRQALALRDGYAVDAAATTDASSYAPVPLTAAPLRVDVGEDLPPGTDAVAPFDAIVLRGGGAEAIAAVAAGEGMLPAGADAMSHDPLRHAGERMRGLDTIIMSAAGIAEVTVRQPRLHITRGSARKSPLIDAARILLERLVSAAGGRVLDNAASLDAALADEEAEAIIAIGGTGSGRNDKSVEILAKRGRVDAHGIAISPGETAAFGWTGTRPVLLIPGRLDAVLAVWFLIGRPLLAKLSGGGVDNAPALLPLKRKAASAIGMTELIPVRCAGGMAEPLASGYLSLSALTQSDGFIVVPADSEGFAAGTEVAVTPWS
jgi:molybdopterin biosynthesis enzyme